jgi:redox-sensitive bicupin YhaK (pirin superfamily)
VIHHEVPAEPRPLHGLQLFVNTPARNKLDPPKTLRLAADLVPEWRSDDGDRVRVVVGSFGGFVSPLVTDQPFTLLDVALHRELAFDLPSDHVAIAYVAHGRLAIDSDGNERQLTESEAIALHGTGGRVIFRTMSRAQILIASGPVLNEPIVMDGPFIMNDAAQIEAAVARYRAGGMGTLGPL